MGLLARARTSFVAGLVLITPLAVTLFVLRFVFARLAVVLDPIVRATGLTAYTANVDMVAELLAAVLLVLFITALGYTTSRSVGKRLFGGFERTIRVLPVVRTVYFGVRGVAESLTTRDERFERTVLVEYPREGLYRIGFVTNDGPAAVAAATGTETVAVFLPNSPNPTAGTLVMVAPDDCHELDMSVRRGLRLVVTTGLNGDAAALPEDVVP